jgi:hypothetical protein
LQEFFSNATDGCFDSNYKGSKNSLLNFRNYFDIYATEDSMSWGASETSYKAATVYTNSSPFSVDSKPSWITAAVYYDGYHITNPADYSSGYDLRLNPSVNSGSARNGTVVIGDGTGKEWDIAVSQSAASTPPTVVCVRADGQTFTFDDQ